LAQFVLGCQIVVDYDSASLCSRNKSVTRACEPAEPFVVTHDHQRADLAALTDQIPP